MLSLDSQSFKKVAENFAKEIQEKYCPDIKIKHSFALEALSHAFGFKDFNTIKPKLEENETKLMFNSISELEEHGFLDVGKQRFNFEQFVEGAQRQLFKKIFLQIVFFYKGTLYPPNKFYLVCDKNQYPDYKEAIDAASFCVDNKIHYFEKDEREVVIFWESKIVEETLKSTKNFIGDGVCMQIFRPEGRARQCVFESRSENMITVKLFDSDGDLSEQTQSFDSNVTQYLTYRSDKEMRMSSMLVYDITNQDFDYMIFDDMFSGMVNARLMVENDSKNASYILDKIYGYNPKFF